MGKKTSTVAGRAWRLLRLPLLRTRKGAEWKPRSLDDSRALNSDTYLSHYSEREFSFDDTPSYQSKTHHRSASLCFLPCLTPSVDFESDEDEYVNFFQKSIEKKYLEVEESDEDHTGHLIDAEEDWDSQTSWSDAALEKGVDEEDQEIDSRAEKFITEFYEKIKLQRHFSPLGRAS
ncbi:hypothetical protein M5K25_001957 [Dendrobium thyrsiflorum]|uniref:Uncharacterized protein n=1 Tax=Dendrobium thyrsiflorum TaxID=117978 RepID=A0ABD0VRS7_DENTH